ncbi:MAG: antibiotic biosynthesis monooxygenase family protein [Planctomycetota bacterium]|jgi:quinol monooxygenase YgiN
MSDIIRIFHATAKPGQERAFQSFLTDEALPIVRGHDGLVSAQVGLPSEESPQEFLMITIWRDLDALKGFTGDNWTEAVIDPKEAPLVESAHVCHFHDASA